MDVQVDHIVHAVQRPEETRHLFERELGFHTVTGGVHPQWGTYNALAYWGLSYMEWIGIQDLSTAVTTDFGNRIVERLAIGEGATQVAFRTRHMDDFMETWTARGLRFDGPVSASRTRPDGAVLRWRMLFPKRNPISNSADLTSDPPPAALPFLIEWSEDDATRLANLTRSGALPDHPSHRLTAIHMVTPDVAAWTSELAAFFDTVFKPVAEVQTEVGFVVPIGDHRLYVWPTRAITPQPVVPGPVQIDLVPRHASTLLQRTVELAGLRIHIASAGET